MKNYTFLNLSPFEFEILTRDLLQLKFKIDLESFGDGADKGIDLRASLNGNLIVQCKRYKDFKTLLPKLKKEVLKVKKLNPDRYILTTSASLTPANKDTIVDLFNPYIQSTSDVFGKEDMNNLLQQFPRVEKSFHKLWLSSVDILQEILNSQIVNQTKFVLDEINEKIRIYVENASFREALSILKENNYVIISGIPGIGKTTLAEMLVFHLLANGMEEFIFLANGINEGFKLFNEDKKQVFLFDDFLGRNFLKNSMLTNEEVQIIRFIKKIQKSKNKRLIFTTREYILNQATQQFDVFDEANFSKCILDISKYTTLVRAKILYNHLYFNNVPFEHINEMIKQDYLLKIIKHPNYNPRIIEAFTKSKLWNDCSSHDFPSELMNLFDNPFHVWQHAYENQISEMGRIILDCLLIAGNEIEYGKLYKQVCFYKENNPQSCNIKRDSRSFKSAIKELDNSLIRIDKKKDDLMIIKYQNPSIQDFLVNYINQNEIAKKQLLTSILYLNPALKVICRTDELHVIGKINVTNDIINQIRNFIISKFDKIEWESSISSRYTTKEDFTILKLHQLSGSFWSDNNILKSFVKNQFSPLIYTKNITSHSVEEFVNLLSFINEPTLDFKTIFHNILTALSHCTELYLMHIVADMFPIAIRELRDSDEEAYYDMLGSVIGAIQHESEYSKDTSELEANISELETIESDFNIDTSDAIDEIKSRIYDLEEMSIMGDLYADSFEDDLLLDRLDAMRPISEIDQIMDLFDSLE